MAQAASARAFLPFHGDLVNVQYSNDSANAPAVGYLYDRLGRRSQATCNGITSAFTYNDVNQPLGESYSGGTLARMLR